MDFLWFDFLGTPAWMWLTFIAIVITLLALDLGLLHKESREIGIRESFMLSAFYMSLGLAFGGWIWFQSGQQAGLEYLTGFVVEKSLAMDNIFVIAMIFGYFSIPRQYQHRVLLWGILGVIVLRGVMIAAGASIVENYHWVLYFFAAFLVFTGVKMLLAADHDYDVAANPVLKYLRRFGVCGGIAHAFNGSRQQADEFIRLGFKLGFGGAMTYPGSTRIRQLAATLPIEAVVLETDAPDIPPVWLAGERNTPGELGRIGCVLAELRNLTSEEIQVATLANARTVLRLP